MRLDQFLYALVLVIRCFGCYYALILGGFGSVDDSVKLSVCYSVGCDLVMTRVGYFGNCLISIFYVSDFNDFR
jgi:hypothetical protein